MNEETKQLAARLLVASVMRDGFQLNWTEAVNAAVGIAKAFERANEKDEAAKQERAA
jgi:hypothetical protein